MYSNTPIEGNSSGNRQSRPQDNDNVHRLSRAGKSIVLVGTAHVSEKSAELVGRIIEEEKPDAVCVELCQARYVGIMQQSPSRGINLIQVVRKQRWMSLPWLLLWYFQKRIGDKLGMRPGSEMIRAIEAAQVAGAAIYPVDRDFRITLERVWKQMGFLTKIIFIFQVLWALGSVDKVREEDIERLKREDMAEKLTRELEKVLPGVRRVLVDERDEYMSEKILAIPADKIIAVVGAGHVPGILRQWHAAGVLESDPRMFREAA